MTYPSFSILSINLLIRVLSFLNKLLLNKEFINLFRKYILSFPSLSLNVCINKIKLPKICSSIEYSLKTSFNYIIQ